MSDGNETAAVENNRKVCKTIPTENRRRNQVMTFGQADLTAVPVHHYRWVDAFEFPCRRIQRLAVNGLDMVGK